MRMKRAFFIILFVLMFGAVFAIDKFLLYSGEDNKNQIFMFWKTESNYQVEIINYLKSKKKTEHRIYITDSEQEAINALMYYRLEKKPLIKLIDSELKDFKIIEEKSEVYNQSPDWIHHYIYFE